MRPGRLAARKTAQKPNAYTTYSIPAPAAGLISNHNLVDPVPGGAAVLENFLPTSTGGRLRRGSQRRAHVSASLPVLAMFSYLNGSVARRFAATSDSIYDVTTQDAETLAPASISSLNGGAWSSVQFATPAGVYLRLVNGVDTPLVYDGSAFSTSPAITSLDAGFDPTHLTYTWVHQQRVFFIQKDSLSAWYLPADSIGGDAVELPLAAVFERGGSLLFGSTWSLETGAGGLAEQCIFVTTEGEVAVFRGADPSTAGTWAKVGLYKIGRPLGPKAHFRSGGDIVIATDIGLIPLSQALQKDFAVLSQTAVSANIDTLWNQEVKDRSSPYWNCTVWSKGQLAIVAPTRQVTQSAVMYVVNTRTGAWGKITGWDATCLLESQGRLYFGSNDGRVLEANVTGLDVTSSYTGVYVPMFSEFGVPGEKTTGMARAVVRSLARVNDQITVKKEYDTDLPSPPAAPSISSPNAWGIGLWGAAKWGVALVKQTYAVWRSAPCNGYALSPALQITSGLLSPLDTEIIKLEVTFTGGEVVT